MRSILLPGLCALALVCAAAPVRAEIVQGFVEDESGAGVPDVSVKFTGDTVGSRPTVETDALGHFSLDLPVDTYRVSFIPTFASRLVPERRFDIVVDAALTLPDVTLFPGVVVSGLVTNAGGTGVANVDVTLDDLVTGVTAFTPNDDTDAAGQYAIVVPPASYEVEFTPPVFPPLVPELLPNVDATSDVVLPTVVLDEGVVVNGTVRDPLGTVVPDVRLDFYDTAGDDVFTTDDDTNEFGVFRVVVDPGTYEIRFLPPGDGRLLPERLFDVDLATDTTLPDVVLDEGFELTGRVVDFGGLPVNDVDLDVLLAGTSERLLTPRDDTGPDGYYRLIVPAGVFDLRYNPPAASGFLDAFAYDVEVTADLERPDVVLLDGYLVTGRLVDAGGLPVADVDLDFIDADTGEFLALSGDDSDADGNFSIVVRPGTYEIRFAPPQMSNFLPFFIEDETIDSDRDFGELTLETGRGISGTVVDGLANPVAGVDVDVLDGGQSVYVEYDETDAAGYFRVVVPDGNYRVLLDPGAASSLFPLLTDELVVVTEVDLGQLELSTGVAVDGLVQDQFGAAVPGATVGFSMVDGLGLFDTQTTTGGDGAFALTLAPGTYDVQYLPPNSLYSSLDAGPFALEADTTLPLAVLERQSALTGRAVDELGTGVPDIDVDVLEDATGDSIPLQNDLTDATGHFLVGVPDGTYRVRLEPSPDSGFFPATYEPFVVAGDTDVGELLLPRGALVSGLVVDGAGEPIRDVEVGVDEPVNGAPKSHLDVTDRGGRYGFLLAPGDYTIWFDPPPDGQFFSTEIGPLAIDADVELPPTVLEMGWRIAGRVVDGGGGGLGGVDIDVLEGVTGDSIPLRDDTTAPNGDFDILVPGGDYAVRVEPDPLTRYLPLVTGMLTVGPNADLGDLALATGFLVEADVFDDVGQPLADIDLDLVDATTGVDQLLVDERTDATGHLATAAAPGDYFAEYKPPRSTRWLPARTGPHAVQQDTLLPPVQLASGFLVSGTVVDGLATPLEGVDTTWLLAGTCDVVFTVRDSTDAAGRYEVALAPGTYDALLAPPPGSGLGGRRLQAIAVADQDVVLPTETLTLDAPPLELCNGADDDCDGAVDEAYPELGASCTVGLGACAATGSTVCSGDGAGTTCDAEPGPPVAEACNGIDDDCNGTVDDGCTSEGFELSFSGDTIAWAALVDAIHYDVVRGDLGGLRSGGLPGASESCLADDSAETSVADATLPPANAVLWYLVRGNTVEGAGTWGTAERDQEIAACAP